MIVLLAKTVLRSLDLLNTVYNEYIKYPSKPFVHDILKTITRYSRIQGSTGLWNAVRDLKEIAEERGYTTRILKIEPGTSKGFVETPISWNPVDAWIEIKLGDRAIATYRITEHPTLLVAHSPGGEGCGSLSICREDTCSGEVVLAHGYTYDLYNNVDADLILYYDENRYHEAFPYAGLFIKPGEEEKNKTIMTIPYKLALHLMNIVLRRGKSLEVCWKAHVKYHNEGLPVLIACRGDEPGVVFISHICHPKPGAHDNASGSAANMVVLDVLGKVANAYKYSSCHIWVPEYTGTVFLYRELPWKPLGVVNLDMVGSKQYITGSTLVVVNPPRFIRSLIAPALWISVQKAMDRSSSFNGLAGPSIRYSLSPYSMGSDHDVFVAWGMDATMLNEWPSKYYHTDMDDLETIDPSNTVYAGLACTLAGYLLTKRKKELRSIADYYSSFIKSWYKLQAMKTGFSLNYLARYLLKKPVIERKESPIMETPILSRTLYKILGRERYKAIRRIKGALAYLGVYAPLAENIGINNHIRHYRAELLVSWKRNEEREVAEAWETIKSALNI